VASARSLAHRYVEHRFAVLFSILLFTIGGHAFVGQLLGIVNPLDWLLGVTMVAVVLGSRQGRLRWVVDSLAVGFVLARLLEGLLSHPAPLLFRHAFFVLACLLAVGASAHRALVSGPVNTERIFAALDVYLLVGIAFGIGYWLLEAAYPDSFLLGRGGILTPARAIYFSFVTQATLGYGDIVPLQPHAEGLVIVQGVGGQMYLAVLIARLVSLYGAPSSKDA